MFSEVKLDDLDLNFGDENSSFGPAQASFNFKDQFDGKLFKPYNKKDKLGRLCEFNTTTSTVQQSQMPSQGTYLAGKQIQAKKDLGESELMENVEDTGFTQVEGKKQWNLDGESYKKYKQQMTTGQRTRVKEQAESDKNFIAKHYKGPTVTKKKAAQQHATPQTNTGVSWSRRGIRDPSYEVEPRWQVVSDFSKQTFDKLPDLAPVDLGVHVSAGRIYAFNSQAWSHARVIKSVKLPTFNGTVFNEQTFLDPIIQKMAAENVANIFATDTAAAALMCSTKAAWSWDLVIKKFRNVIFIDKRSDENMLDWQTVSETAQENQPNDDDTINGARLLMKEASKISNNFLHACTDKTKFQDFQQADPFIEHDDQLAARVGYEYRVWKLDATNKICIRCTIPAYDKSSNEKISVFVLPEWNLKHQNWVKLLDGQTAVCFTREIADNSSKFSRWTVQSKLAGISSMRFAFVQRSDPQALTHKVVGSFTVNTQTFVNQINLNYANCWATLRDVLYRVLEREEPMADFLYLKDPAQVSYRLIKMEKNTSGDDSGDEEDDGL